MFKPGKILKFHSSKQTLFHTSGSREAQSNRAVSFCKRRQPGNKERELGIHRLAGVAYLPLFVTRKSLLSLAVEDWLARHNGISGQGKYFHGPKSYLSLGLLIWHPSRNGSILSLVTYFNKS